MSARIVLKAFLDAGIEPNQMVVGVMANSYIDAAAQASAALDAACRGVLLAPPSYFKNVSDDGLFAWFFLCSPKSAHRHVSIILYNIPSVTAVEISVELVSRLREAFPAVIVGRQGLLGQLALH